MLPSRRKGRLARPAIRSGGGNGESGPRRRDPDAEAQGVEDPRAQGRGQTPSGPGRRPPAAPARGARTGSPVKKQTIGPGASKTLRAERLSFAETQNHTVSGRRPGRSATPPATALIPARRRRLRASPRDARFPSQFRPESLYVAGLGADRIRASKTVRSRRLNRRLPKPCDRAFHRPNI